MMTTVHRPTLLYRSRCRLGLAVFAVAFSFSCAEPEFLPAGDRGLNVLVITLDTIRADRLGAYGNTRV